MADQGESIYRIAFAVVKYFPYGGMQRNTLRIARACARRGHRVHIFASAWDGPRPEELEVELLRVRAWTNHDRNRRFGQAVREAVAGAGFDCVVGSNRLPGLDVYYAGDPCYADMLARKNPTISAVLPRYREFLRQEQVVFDRRGDTEILLSAHAEMEKFIRHHGTAASRFHLLPPGIDRSRLVSALPTPSERLDLRAALEIGVDDTMLLQVGSNFGTKGVDRTIRAMSTLPAAQRDRTHLVVVGLGRPRAFIVLARRLGVADRLTFTGPRDDLASFYGSADFLVHPAVVENTGNALIEAMVCGLPVLVTESCGYAFHVERAGAGVVSPSPFSQARFDADLRSMLDGGDRARWGANALAYCEREDLYGMIDSAADVIIARATRNRAAAEVAHRV
jgi:UDP-glucose:(heptosyl)LPS alpha-1,3-glucosyltransferase